MNYYKMMELADLIDSGLVSPMQYMKWADTLILLQDKPEYFLLELCVATVPQEAINVIYSALSTKQMPLNNGEEYYSWDRENYYIGFLYLKTKYGKIKFEDFLQEAGCYSDAVNTNWDCEDFFILMNEEDEHIKRMKFLKDWKDYVEIAEKIYHSFQFKELL